jgi:membrane-associated protein
VLGEAVWVGLYVGVGYYFAGNLQAASSMAIELVGFLAAGSLAVGLIYWLVLAVRADRARE